MTSDEEEPPDVHDEVKENEEAGRRLKEVQEEEEDEEDEEETSEEDSSDNSDSDFEEEEVLKIQFDAFIKYNNTRTRSKRILNSQSDFWLKQARVMEGRMLTRTDTGVCFFKFKKHKLSFREYKCFLRILADYKNIDVDDIVGKLVTCGPPGCGDAEN